jgi:thioredoxin 1
MSANISDLTTNTFKTAIATGTVLIDLWAPWCGPCKAIAPVLEELAADPIIGGNLTIAKLNVDDHGALAAEYDVRAIPTFLVFKNGRLAEKIVGVNGITTKAGFIARLQPHL